MNLDTKTPFGKETVVQDVPEEKRKECCISNDIALELGRLSLKVYLFPVTDFRV